MSRATTRPASFGSISSGTMRDDDLLPAFADELEYQLERQSRRFARKEYRALIREARRALRHMEDGTVKQAEAAEESASEIISDLMDRLTDFAPPYAYFGAHPGDGADYGFWLVEDLDCFDGLRVEDTSEVPRGYRGEVLHVNDHGNMTLYAATSRGLREVWSLV